MLPVRRLAAILAADVVGYSRLMGFDEAGTVKALREHRAAADPIIADHGGRVVKTTGDGLLIEFGSVVGAVECALGLQRLVEERNAGTSAERRMKWRIGVYLGDVLIEGDDILGDGVNIAARLEGIAEPNWICISEDAFRQVRVKVEAEFADLGEQSLKNIARPLRVYCVGSSPAANQPISPAATLPLPDKPSIAVLPFSPAPVPEPQKPAPAAPAARPSQAAELLDDFLLALLDLPGDAWPDIAAALPDEIFGRIDRYLEKWLADGD
jgi:adenylate cyclase